MIYMLVVLKIPVILMIWLVFWAAKTEEEEPPEKVLRCQGDGPRPHLSGGPGQSRRPCNLKTWDRAPEEIQL